MTLFEVVDAKKSGFEALLFEVDAWSQGYVIFSIIPTGPVSATSPAWRWKMFFGRKGCFKFVPRHRNPQKDLSKEAGATTFDDSKIGLLTWDS